MFPVKILTEIHRHLISSGVLEYRLSAQIMIILVEKTLIIFAHGVIIFIIFKSLYSSQIAKFPYRKTSRI